MRLRTVVTSLATAAAILGGGVFLASPASAGVPTQNGCRGTSFDLFAINPDVGYCFNGFPGSDPVSIYNVRALQSNSYWGYIIANGQRIDFSWGQTISLDYVYVTDVTLLGED
ncbi:hypothetical protein [Kutzneria buriramensis]|uniref:Beta/gamma crystallin n=1 Tax=Kutzneria buriramensis TaxID=1045776 RepID=A0A3E0I132_9PSEU|nr:hypothetical protein [Kutzneria buriramensis]REH52246.1 hypothetical protein BCF44_103698 [Kutzneria buriramensis]